MDVCFEILVPIQSEIPKVRFSQPSYEWDGVLYPQGPEEALFEYFKLRKSTVPDHISSFLPIALQKCKWQCISVVEGLDEFNNRILDINSNTAIDIALLSDLLNALIGHEDKWVVVFEPDCDRVDEVSKGSIADVVEQILQSLQVKKKGFIIWYNYGF